MRKASFIYPAAAVKPAYARRLCAAEGNETKLIDDGGHPLFQFGGLVSSASMQDLRSNSAAPKKNNSTKDNNNNIENQLKHITNIRAARLERLLETKRGITPKHWTAAPSAASGERVAFETKTSERHVRRNTPDAGRTHQTPAHPGKHIQNNTKSAWGFMLATAHARSSCA